MIFFLPLMVPSWRDRTVVTPLLADITRQFVTWYRSKAKAFALPRSTRCCAMSLLRGSLLQLLQRIHGKSGIRAGGQSRHLTIFQVRSMP